MAESEKMPVTVYQVDQFLFPEQELESIAHYIIGKANKDQLTKYTEEKTSNNIPEAYKVKLYSSCKQYRPKWRSFLGGLLAKDSKLKECMNRMYSFVCFIQYDKQIFAITGGLGSFAIDLYVNQNFGLEILIRLFEKDSKVIKSIQDRGVTGVVLGQIKSYRGDQRFSDENQFGKIFKQVKAELNKKILTKTLALLIKNFPDPLQDAWQNHHFK